MPKIKAILSSCLLVLFPISLISGLMLWIWKGGMVLGIPRYIITGVHDWGSVAFAAVLIVHFAVNLRVYRREIAAFRSNKRGR